MTTTRPHDGDDEPVDATSDASDRDEPADDASDASGRATDASALPADDVSPAATARVRARVYGLLAATFDGDAETVAAAVDDDAFVDLAAALPVDVDTAPLAGADLDPDALAVGYDNLFVVPGPHYVPPFASAHATDPSESFESDSPYHDAGDAGELFGDPAADAARLYAATGFEPERGDGIPDHVAALFEFMRALCAREAALLEGGDGAAAERSDGATDDGATNAEADAADPDGELATVRDAQREALSRLGWLDAFDEAVAREDSVEGVFATLARIARSFAAWDAREGVA
ncbi:MAG: molecular chaperone TorD family protein [Haloferacaceae archaeon]